MTNYNLELTTPKEIEESIIENTGIEELKKINPTDFSISLIKAFSVEIYKMYNKINYARNILDPAEFNGKTLSDWYRIASYFGVDYFFKKSDELFLKTKRINFNFFLSYPFVIKRISHSVTYNGNNYMLENDVEVENDFSDLDLKYFKYDGINVLNRSVNSLDTVVINNNKILENKVYVFIDNGLDYDFFENVSFKEFNTEIMTNSDKRKNIFNLKKDINGFYNIELFGELNNTNITIVYFTYSDDDLLLNTTENLNFLEDSNINSWSFSNEYTYEKKKIITVEDEEYEFFKLNDFDFNIKSGFLADSNKDLYFKVNSKLRNIKPILTEQLLNDYLLSIGVKYSNVKRISNSLLIITDRELSDEEKEYINSLAWTISSKYEIFKKIDIDISFTVKLYNSIDSNKNIFESFMNKELSILNLRKELDRSDLIYLAKKNSLIDSASVMLLKSDSQLMNISLNYDEIIKINNVTFTYE